MCAICVQYKIVNIYIFVCAKKWRTLRISLFSTFFHFENDTEIGSLFNTVKFKVIFSIEIKDVRAWQLFNFNLNKCACVYYSSKFNFMARKHIMWAAKACV